jgi:acyl-coenzyme A thioesterase PaaI-like protein
MARRLSPRLFRLAMNLWPPYWGAGIRVEFIAPDFRAVTVALVPRWYNRNNVGTHFGGSLYAMTDPFFALMVMHNLSSEYVVWDKSASIDYLAPGRGRVWARFELAESDLEHIRTMTESGDKHLHLFTVDVRDAEGMAVAHVEKIVYVRRRRKAS